MKRTKTTLRFMLSLSFAMAVTAIFITEYSGQLLTAAAILILTAAVWGLAETAFTA